MVVHFYFFLFACSVSVYCLSFIVFIIFILILNNKIFSEATSQKRVNTAWVEHTDLLESHSKTLCGLLQIRGVRYGNFGIRFGIHPVSCCFACSVTGKIELWSPHPHIYAYLTNRPNWPYRHSFVGAVTKFHFLRKYCMSLCPHTQ